MALDLYSKTDSNLYWRTSYHHWNRIVALVNVVSPKHDLEVGKTLSAEESLELSERLREWDILGRLNEYDKRFSINSESIRSLYHFLKVAGEVEIT